MQVNDVNLVGHLTRDPEVQYTPKGTPVTKAGVGINENYTTPDGEKKSVTTFVDIEVWGASAENLAKLARKGEQLFVQGSLREEQWQDKETGKPRWKLFVKAEKWQFTQYRVTEAARQAAKQQAQGVER